MGNGQDDHHHCNKPTNFLPMFCRLSLHDVKPTHHNKIPATPAATGDPISPKVSCIGQVKRNSRVVGFPASAVGGHKHRKVPFSARTLLPNAAAMGGSTSCRANYLRRSVRVKDNNNCDNNNKVVDVGEMDPPLPVVKTATAAAPEASLGKRRGKNIERLKIEEIKLGINNGGFGFVHTSLTTA